MTAVVESSVQEIEISQARNWIHRKILIQTVSIYSIYIRINIYYVMYKHLSFLSLLTTTTMIWFWVHPALRPWHFGDKSNKNMYKTWELQFCQSNSPGGTSSKEHVKSLSSRNSNVQPLIYLRLRLPKVPARNCHPANVRFGEWEWDDTWNGAFLSLSSSRNLGKKVENPLVLSRTFTGGSLGPRARSNANMLPRTPKTRSISRPWVDGK